MCFPFCRLLQAESGWLLSAVLRHGHTLFCMRRNDFAAFVTCLEATVRLVTAGAHRQVPGPAAARAAQGLRQVGQGTGGAAAWRAALLFLAFYIGFRRI